MNAAVFQLAVIDQPFVVPAPRICDGCTRRKKAHTVSGNYVRNGTIAFTRGFCALSVHMVKCSSCKKLVARDGREHHIVLLSWTTAGTAVWVRSMANMASLRMALTT